jgi:hypothetical protein
VDADDVADELYALPPEEFIAARREREARARSAGDRELAKEIAGLAKPSTAAWVCNLLAREQREEIEGLVELGGMLREAQENLAGDELRALDVQRRRLVAALARQGRALAHGHGHPVSTAVADQVEETLRAALADPDAAEALADGRLTTALSYSGLGTGDRPNLKVVRPKEPAAKAPRPAGRSSRDRGEGATARRREREEAARRAAEEQRRRELEEARRAAEEAAAAAREAVDAQAAEQAQVARLRAHEQELHARVEELTEELARVREEGARAGAELSRAERRQKTAARHAADAEAALERARAHVQALEARG